MHDPFHPGERAIQEKTGQRDVALRNGRLIADRVPATAKLFIDLATRRRLRVNGRVVRFADAEIAVAIDQAHPLCPKYIQRRRLEEHEPSPPTGTSGRVRRSAKT